MCSYSGILCNFADVKIAIKNMVCDRCVASVRALLAVLGYGDARVGMGWADVPDGLDGGQLDAIARALEAEGFELLRGSDETLVERIKAALIALARRADGQPVFAPVDRVGVRFVELLADDALAGAPREETGENATEESEGGRPHGAAPFREITIESSLVAMSYCTPVAGVRCLTSTRYSSGAISMNERIVRPASAENVSPHER